MARTRKTSETLRLRYRLRAGLTLRRSATGRIAVATAAGELDFPPLSPGQAAVLEGLRDRGGTEAELCSTLVAADGPAATPWLFFTLTQLAQRGVVELTLGTPQADAVTVQPLSRVWQPNDRVLPPDASVRLCRFAYLHRHEDALLLESPRALAQLVLHDAHGPALLAGLAAPVRAAKFGSAGPTAAPAGRARAFLQLLFQQGFLETVPVADAAPRPADETELALQQWEFHDLLFHARSRAGRHRNAWGATYRWEGRRQPLPAVKAMTGEPLPLPRPDLAALKAADLSFATVVESRRSRRLPGVEPLTLRQLGEFLFRSSRVRGRLRTEHEEVSNRPYPGGGADYELEIYPIVQRCDGCAPGVYYYEPLKHALFRIADAGPGPAALLREASQKARLTVPPDVLLCVTARFQRLTYKYSSIAYAILLKDLGVLYQTFYLNATAMGLAPCAVGGGDADLFAAVTRLPYFVEPSVGEFLLSSANAAEPGAGPLPDVAGA